MPAPSGSRWSGPDALAALAVPLSGLFADPRNARSHDARSVLAIGSSLRLYGQQKPIVVDASGMVLAGNGLFQAATEIGWTHLAVVVTNLTDADDVTGYKIADNRAAELSEWDLQQLDEQLTALAVGGLDLEMIGFTSEEIDEIASGVVDDDDEEESDDADEAPRGDAPERTSGEEASSGGSSDYGGAASGAVTGFNVLVVCADIDHQSRVLEELAAQGFNVKALN